MIALETRSLTQVVRVARRHPGRQPRLRDGAALRHHRPERRRQDHLFQPPRRQPAARLRRDPARRPRRDHARRDQPGAHRHRALVPAQQRVPRLHRAGEPGARLRAADGIGADLLAADVRPFRSRRGGGDLAAEVGLADVLDTAVRRISYGSQRQLEVALALACRPKVLLLDEPTSGIGPEERRACTR